MDAPVCNCQCPAPAPGPGDGWSKVSALGPYGIIAVSFMALVFSIFKHLDDRDIALQTLYQMQLAAPPLGGGPPLPGGGASMPGYGDDRGMIQHGSTKSASSTSTLHTSTDSSSIRGGIMADMKKISLEEPSSRMYQSSVTDCSEYPERVGMEPSPIDSHPPQRTFGSNQMRERFHDPQYIARAI